jgi:hypothetical protein
LEQLKNYFHAHPQGHELANAFIKIGYFSPLHRLLTKIVLHNLWPTTRRSKLVLKRAQFLYALCMRMPFCLCKHSIGLPFACLITKLIIQYGIDVFAEFVKRIQDSLGSQTLMKSLGGCQLYSVEGLFYQYSS